MAKLKIGIIGAGLAWERLHFPAYKRLTEQFQIVAVCDKNKEQAENAVTMIQASGLGANVKAYDSYQQMLQDKEYEACDIMVPISENYEVAKAVITNGVHLIAEKPFAATVEGAKELIKLAKSLDVKVLVAENYRYSQENELIKDIINSKKIGNVTYFISNHVSEFQKEMMENGFASTEWRQHPEFGGGIFLDSAIHDLARLRFLFGDVQKVYALGRPTQSEFTPYSCINALLSFLDHISGHFCYFMIGKETQAPLVGLRIFGTDGEIFLEEKDCGFVNLTLKNGYTEAIPYQSEEGYYNELMNFYQALENNETIVCNPEKELGDIQLVYDILKSIETEKAIEATNQYPKKKPRKFL